MKHPWSRIGGLFVEEQVEDVKTVLLRFLPLFSIIGAAQIEFVHYVSLRYMRGTGTDENLQGVEHKHLQCFIDNKGLFYCSMFIFKTDHPALFQQVFT